MFASVGRLPAHGCLLRHDRVDVHVGVYEVLVRGAAHVPLPRAADSITVPTKHAAATRLCAKVLDRSRKQDTIAETKHDVL